MLQYCRLTVKASGIQKSTILSALVSLIHTKSVQQHISKAVNKSLSLKKDTSPKWMMHVRCYDKVLFWHCVLNEDIETT